MMGNKLTQIKVDTFKGLRSLEKLVLANSEIRDIATGAFIHINRCKKLWLSDNKLTVIRKGMFEGLDILEKLYLKRNDITHIEDSAFSRLRNLTQLWLYGNKLTHITVATFERLSHLTHLSLGENEISDIEPGLFKKLTSLRRLTLFSNELKTLERNVLGNQHPTNLTLLLGGNPLQCDSMMCWIKHGEEDGWITLNLTLAHGFWSKPNCANYPDRDWDTITLSCAKEGDCYVYQQKYMYTKGTYRRDGCGLTQVPTSIPEDASKVYLSNNQISDIRTAAFSQLTNCTELWFNNNTLTHIDVGDFVDLQSLKKLILENNFITEIQTAAFVHLEQCSHILMKGNRLTHINTDMFIGLPFLEKLSLSDNKINNIEPETFAKMSELMVLDLDKNNISNISPETFAQRSLSKIHLQGNRLTTLERNIFGSQHPTNLTLLLSGNTLQCDSRLCWIKEAEHYGSITLNFPLSDASWSKPPCANYPDVDWDNITLSCPVEGSDHDDDDDSAKNYIFYIVGGLLLLCIVILVLVKISQSCRRRTSVNRKEDNHFYLTLQRRPQLPELPTNQGPTQENEYSAGYDVKSVPCPRHYVTELPGRESDDSGYEVPSNRVIDHHEENVYHEIERRR